MNCRLTISSADREPWTDRSFRRSYGLYHCTFLCIVRTLYRTCTFHRFHQEATTRKIVDIFIFCQNDLSASFVYQKTSICLTRGKDSSRISFCNRNSHKLQNKMITKVLSLILNQLLCFFKDFNSSCLKTLFYINFLMANESLYIQ